MRYILLLSFIFLTTKGISQKENKLVMAFPITDYINVLNDSVKLVQILMSDGLAVKEKAVGLLKPKRISSDADSIEIGYGKCQLIKGDYYYFAITVNKKSRQPKAGDLLYTTLDLTGVYNGNLFNVARHAITFSKIDETPLLILSDVLLMSKKEEEDARINQFADEVKFTGKTMIEQNDNQDMVISKGPYTGKKLFATMIDIKNSEIIDCLEYINARPALYAGYDWKFSEIFATWMSEGAPTVIKD